VSWRASARPFIQIGVNDKQHSYVAKAATVSDAAIQETHSTPRGRMQ